MLGGSAACGGDPQATRKRAGGPLAGAATGDGANAGRPPNRVTAQSPDGDGGAGGAEAARPAAAMAKNALGLDHWALVRNPNCTGPGRRRAPSFREHGARARGGRTSRALQAEHP